MSKFSLLKTVDHQVKTKLAEDLAQQELNALVVEAFNTIGAEHKTTGEALFEAATHVLANIVAAASQGAPIKAMNASTLASFLAGVEVLATGLPRANPEQKANALKVIQAASIGPDGMITTGAAPIAQLGAKRLETNMKYGEIVKKYVAAANAQDPNAGQELVAVARKLQTELDRAMRAGTAPSADLGARVQQDTRQLAPVQRAQAQAPQSIRPALAPQSMK